MRTNNQPALPRRANFSAALLLLTLLYAASALGQSSDELAEDLIHSDLPIFGSGGENQWPQHFVADDEFGCASRVAFGDWMYRGQTDDDDVGWYRFTNYGVFHCWANTYRAFEREKLDGADHHPSFFVLLGSTRVDDRDMELWTVQIGAVPGSEYLLLSRDPSDEIVESFNVLQTDCPRANVREAGSLDILLTRYCAINTRRELIHLAKRMAQRPPLGTLVRVATDEEPAETERE